MCQSNNNTDNTKRIADLVAQFETMLKELAANKPVSAPVSLCGTRRQIVIGDRGWVWVGDVSREGDDYVIRNAQCIRIWGTTQGLGELATKGKTSKTVLDPAGTIMVPVCATVARYDVKEGVSL